MHYMKPQFVTDESGKKIAVTSLAASELSDRETPILEFGIQTRMFDGGAQFDRFEPELLRLAGSLNFAIELSQYP